MVLLHEPTGLLSHGALVHRSMDSNISPSIVAWSLEGTSVLGGSSWSTRTNVCREALPQLRDVASDDQNLGLQTRLVIDRDTAARFGIRPQTIDDTLYDAFGQRQISTIFTQSNQYRVVLEVKPEFQNNLQDLKHLYLRSAVGGQVPPSTTSSQGISSSTSTQVPISAAGGQVPLSALTRVETSTAPLAVNHQGQFPVVTISFNI